MDSSQVELCKAFGDPSKPKAWSKHSQKAPTSEKQTEKPVADAAPAGTKKVSCVCFRELRRVSGTWQREEWPGMRRRGQRSWDSRYWSPGSGTLCPRIDVPCMLSEEHCASNEPF